MVGDTRGEPGQAGKSDETNVANGTAKFVEKKDKFAAAMKAVAIAKLMQMDGQPVEIAPGLFIGSVGAAMNKSALEAAGITHILTVAKDLRAYYEAEFTYLVLPIGDTPFDNIYDIIPAGVDFIDEAMQSGGSILVHCFAGKSRSTSIITAYLMLTRLFTLEAAMQFIRAKRPQAQPNAGFCAQLKKWERYVQYLDKTGATGE